MVLIDASGQVVPQACVQGCTRVQRLAAWACGAAHGACEGWPGLLWARAVGRGRTDLASGVGCPRVGWAAAGRLFALEPGPLVSVPGWLWLCLAIARGHRI